MRPRRVAQLSCRSRSIARWSPRSRPTSASVTTSRFANRLVTAGGLAALGICAATPGRGQGLSATEASVGAMVVLAHHALWGPELAIARRPGGQGRFTPPLPGRAHDPTLPPPPRAHPPLPTP